MDYVKVEKGVATYAEDTGDILISVSGVNRHNDAKQVLMCMDEEMANFLFIDLAKAIWDKRDDEEEKKIKERLKEALK